MAAEPDGAVRIELHLDPAVPAHATALRRDVAQGRENGIAPDQRGHAAIAAAADRILRNAAPGAKERTSS